MNELMIAGMICVPFGLGWLIGRATCCKPDISKLDPRRVYQPTKYPYPLDYEMRRAMVLRHISSGVLALEDAKEYLADGTISVNDYRQARDDLHALNNPVPMPSPRQHPRAGVEPTRPW